MNSANLPSNDLAPKTIITEEDAPQQLPPAISYYLRKLLRQNLDRLSLIEENPHYERLDPNAVLDGLCCDDKIPDATVQKLESLVISHQEFLNQGVKYRRPLYQVEQEIFAILGLRLRQSNHYGTILIVDDTPENLRLLSTTLMQQGYEVRNAINGPLALSRARAIKPDLILLDIMMPGMDGYEVCHRLKQDPQTQDVPIIFISAIDAVFDKVKAFEVGGVDYVVKPFQIEEVLARIEHQLKIWNLQRRLEDQNIRFQEDLQEQRSQEGYSQLLFDNAIDGMFQTSLDGHFQQVNQQLAEMLGFENSVALIANVANVASLYVKPGRRAEFVSQIQQKEQIHNFESEVYRQDGSVIWLTETAKITRDETGRAIGYLGTVRDITDLKAINRDRDVSRQRIRRLLLSLFPKPIAKQFIRNQEKSFANYFPEVSVLSVQFQGISDLTLSLPPEALIERIHQTVKACDRLAEDYGIEYTKTTGSHYLAASGLPTKRTDHAIRIAQFALALQQMQVDGELPLRLQMGIHSGAVVAGIVGEKHLSYELYGETLHLAELVEQRGRSDRIQITETTHQYLQGRYSMEAGQTIYGSGNVPTATYWLLGAG
jgi:adenylate cyclase